MLALRAGANIGGDFVWEFKVQAGAQEGRILIRGDMVLHAEYGGKTGLEALEVLRTFDVITYEAHVYEGDLPNSSPFSLSEVEKLRLKVVYENLKPAEVSTYFYDLLVRMEEEKKTALAFFPDTYGETTMMAFVEGDFVALRTAREEFSLEEKLKELRLHRTTFHVLEGDFVPYMSGYFYLSKVYIDTPAGSWNEERIRTFEGVLESFGVGDRIVIVSDGSEILLVMRIAVPPLITSRLLKEFQRRGRLVDAYPVVEFTPVFRYAFRDIPKIRETFNRLISESRKLVGEVIFNMASKRVLNFAHPSNSYPDEYADFTKNVYKQYEKEIASFTGKRWREIKENVLRGVEEHIAEIFNGS